MTKTKLDDLPCFRGKPRPLKIGIFADLVALGYEPEAVRAKLALWTRQPAYLEVCLCYAPRIDVYGSLSGVVTYAQSRHAAGCLLVIKVAKRNAAMASGR